MCLQKFSVHVKALIQLLNNEPVIPEPLSASTLANFDQAYQVL
jgi:hypothetical protein